jgi:spermidine synthase
VKPLEEPQPRSVGLVLLMCLAFGASGAAALTFETLWFTVAGLAFGNGAWASSLVLGAMMAGMAAGGGLAARYADRVRRPLHVFASLEVLVAASGVAVVYGLPGAGRWLAPLATPLADHPAVLNVARLVTDALVLCIPSTAMGAGLPLVALALGRSDRNFGRVLGRLYGANVVGAVLGVLATDRWSLATFGVRGSSLWAGALDLAAAGTALGLPLFGIAGVTTSPTRDPSPRGEDRGSSIGAVRPLVAAFLLGFCLLALEILWLRLLTLFMNDTPSAFATLLATVLAGMSAGGWVASVWLGRSPGASAYAGFMAYGAALCALVGYIAYPSLLERSFDARQSGSLPLVIAVPLVMPASAASGALFALLGAGLRESTRSDARAAGGLAAFNTTGSACGSAVAGFVLLPWLGLDKSLFCVLILYGAAGVLLTVNRPWRSRAAAALAFGLCLVSFPFGAMRQKLVAASARRWMGPRDEIVAVRESPTATIVQIRHELSGMTIYDQFAQNAYSMTSNNFAARRYMKLFAYLPLAIHPGMHRALVIGYGMGNTAQALTDTRELERIDVVDTTSDLIEMTRRAEPAHGRDPLGDPRLRVHIEDGRYFLQSTSDSFDLITGEPPPPIIAGVVSLYTREYFDLARSRLAEGGIVSYWLPTMDIAPSSARSLLRAFCDAFPDCSLWHAAGPNFMLMGTRGAVGPVTESRFLAQWLDPVVERELSALGFELPGELSSLFIGDARYLAEVTRDVPSLEDDFPKRMQAESGDDSDPLTWSWRDTRAARDRFLRSPFVEAHWPASVRKDGARHFENQRLIDDLLFPGRTDARQTAVLDQVLVSTPLRFPVLLLLSSDPDVQQALASAEDATREQPELGGHRIAGCLAHRDVPCALEALAHTSDASLRMPGLRAYLQSISEAEP